MLPLHVKTRPVRWLPLALALTAAACVGPCRRAPAPSVVAYDLAARAPIAPLDSAWMVSRLASAESELLQERGFRRLSGPGSDEAAAIAPRATMLLPMAEPLVDRKIVVDIGPEEAGRGKHLEVAVDAQLLGRQELDERTQLLLDLPAGQQRTPRQRLRFLFPEEEDARGGQRAGPPAARVHHVVVGAADDPAMPAIARMGSPVRARDGVLYQAAPSRLRFALLHPGSAELHVLPGLSADAAAGTSVRGRVLMRDDAGERELWSGRLTAGERPEVQRIAIPGQRGDAFELVLAAEEPSDPAAPFLAWGAPKVMGASLVDPLQHDDRPRPAPAEAPTVDGVLLVIFDAARARQFGCYGYGRDTTPEIDRLAREGIVFENHMTPAVTTSAAMSAIWSSQYPDAGQSEWLHDGKMPSNRLTLAELLTAQGVKTAGFIANPSAGPTVGLDRGFEKFERLYREPWHTGKPPGAEIFRTSVYPWIEQAPEGRFLLYAHWREPHTPYYPPPIEGPDAPLPEAAKWYQWWAPVNNGNQPVSPAEKDHLVRLYDGNLLYADKEFGAMRQQLEKAGLWDRLAVLMTGDHGEMLFEHGYYGHNIELYEPLVRVPMVVRLPPSFGMAGRRVTALTDHLDVAPTIAEVLGLLGKGGSDKAFRGRSLLEVARTGEGARGVVSRTIDTRPTYAVITPDWKLLHDLPTGEEHLFDLRADPGETRDLAAERPFVRAALRQSLYRWLLDMRSTEAGEVERAAPDATDVEVLRALGYVE